MNPLSWLRKRLFKTENEEYRRGVVTTLGFLCGGPARHEIERYKSSAREDMGFCYGADRAYAKGSLDALEWFEQMPADRLEQIRKEIAQ